MTATPPIAHKWSPDRPCSHPDEDKLHRRSFAEQVAKEIRAWGHKESLVLSLNGEWGSGKSTLANLIKHYAERKQDGGNSSPVFVRFNPWQWSGQGKVMEAFFDEIGTAFNTPEVRGQKQAEQLAAFWRGFKVLTLASAELANGLQNAITAGAALLAGASGTLASVAKDHFWQQSLANLSIGLLFVAALCQVWAPFAEKMADAFGWRAQQKLSLEEARRLLKKHLLVLTAPVVVIIDDLDRLTKDEVRHVVQLVKANADFPNLVYLLLFQKSIVAKALDDVTAESGHEFLKKIIQIELEVPAAPDAEMRKLFGEEIDRVILRAEYRWDANRWSEVFEDLIWPWFRTVRDIKRYRGMLDFYFEAHVVDGVLNVNLIDLILLEILRMFAPSAYAEVSKAFQRQRNVFLGEPLRLKETRERFKASIEIWAKADGLDLNEGERLRRLLLELFPQATEEGDISGETRNEWVREMRVCHADFFPRYFNITLGSQDISAALVRRVINPSATIDQIKEIMRTSLEAGTLRAMLTQLRATQVDIPQDSLLAIIAGILDLTDEMPKAARGFFAIDDEAAAVGFIIQLLRRIADHAQRLQTLQKAIAGTRAVTGPVMVVAYVGPRKNKNVDEPLFSETESKELQALLLPRMWEAALDGRIWSLNRSTYILYRLSEWAPMQEVIDWLNTAIMQPAIALAFLRGLLRESQISGGGRARQIYTLLVAEMARFVSLELLMSIVSQAQRNDLEEAAFKQLRKAVELRNTGKDVPEIYVASRDAAGILYYDESDGR